MRRKCVDFPRWPPKLRVIAGAIAALVAGGLVLALEMWTLVPAPTLSTLALAATIPELTPWAIALCILAGAIAQLAGSGWARNVGVGCAAAALGCALVPWCLLPGTIARCEREMQLDFGSSIPRRAGAPPTLRQPYDWRLAFAGFGRTADVRVIHNLPVRTRDGRTLGLDLYLPAARGRHPAVVLVYGGAWIFGSRAGSAELGRSLAHAGYAAIAVDYRHAPRWEYPTQINDVRDAVATIARHAAAWEIDPQRVAVFGRSSGAQLALLVAYDPGPVRIRAVVGYYSPTDLVQGYRLPPQPDPADVRRILRAYLGGTPEERIGNYVGASPIAHVRPGLPPTLLIGGGRDELVRLAFGHEMRDALRARGNHVAALDLPWSNHAFDSIPNGTAGQIARYYTERFLRVTL